jgi:hypothetical protein
VHCLLVATGHAERSALDGAGADAVIADLRDTDAVVNLVLPS